MRKTALIMAGGKGERFWPKSRQNLPKQFLSLTDDGKTMIQLTVERILPLVEIQDIYVVTNEQYKQLVAEQLPDLPEENILCEPDGRNTAPCIGLGAAYIKRKYGDAMMIVLPADHLIKYNDIFARTLENACDVAEEGNNLVTLGIVPNYPETGYGYIKTDNAKRKKEAYEVEQFVEKPDYEVAKSYVENGNYYWNSGMFVWKVSSLFYNMKKYMFDTYKGLMSIYEVIGTEHEATVLKEIFLGFASNSIDYGIMEKASDIYLIPGTFGWDDVGSWLAVERIRETDKQGNVYNNNAVALNTKNCTIVGNTRLIATIGIENLIVVDTDDVLLIAEKRETENIKKLLFKLREEGKDKYL